MRIGIFSPYLDTFGGGERYMLTIAEYLSADCGVDIFWDDKSVIDKAKHYLNLNLEKTHFVSNIFSRTHSLFGRIITTCQYDVIIYLSDGSIPMLAAKKNILHFQRPFIFKTGLTVADRVKLRSIVSVICNSSFTKRYIDETFRVNSAVLFPPVAVDQFHPLVKKKHIISVGRFTRVPGNKKQHEMIALFKRVSGQMPAWQFQLAGGVRKEDRLYLTKLEGEIDRSIKLLPNIPFDKLITLYGEAAIYWHAAGFGEDEKKHPDRFEHFGITTVEAMSAGCVPIVFNGGGQKEIITHNVDGFLWNTREELIDYTVRVATDENLRSHLAANAVKKSKLFATKHFCKQIRQLVISN